MCAMSNMGKRKAVYGMIHLRPLPGTPFYEQGSFQQTLDIAVRGAVGLRNGGADGCLVQTVDRVASVRDESDPARIAAATLVVQAIVQATGGGEFHIGVQLMRNSIKASLAIAQVAGADFVRVGAIVGMTLTPHGLIEANPLEVMEYRSKINAWKIAIIADIHSMHFQWMGPARSVADVARAALHVGADAVALADTDEDKTLQMIAEVRAAVPQARIFLAGYTNQNNVRKMMAAAGGAFVGTCLERDGWGGEIDPEKVRSYMEAARQCDC